MAKLLGIYRFEDVKVRDMQLLTALKDKLKVLVDGDKKVIVVVKKD